MELKDEVLRAKLAGDKYPLESYLKILLKYQESIEKDQLTQEEAILLCDLVESSDGHRRMNDLQSLYYAVHWRSLRPKYEPKYVTKYERYRE